MTNHKILLVDDDQNLLEMLFSIFKRAGYTNLLTAASGAQALRVWRDEQPNLIVLDVMMRTWTVLPFEGDTPHKPGPRPDADRSW